MLVDEFLETIKEVRQDHESGGRQIEQVAERVKKDYDTNDVAGESDKLRLLHDKIPSRTE